MSNHYSSQYPHSNDALYACADPVFVLIDKATDTSLVVTVRDPDAEKLIRDMLEAVAEP